MKKSFFFSAISIAMIFAMSLLTSCQKECLTCGYKTTPPPQGGGVVIVPPPPVKMQMSEKIIYGGVRFTGWVFCYYLHYGPWVDVRDKDGNDLHVIRCDDNAILNKLDVDMCFWDYSTGPAGVGGSGDALVVVYEDGTLAKVDGYPKYLEPSFRVTHFYGKVLGKKSIQSDSVKFDLDLGGLKYKDTIEFKVDTANAVIHKLDLK